MVAGERGVVESIVSSVWMLRGPRLHPKGGGTCFAWSVHSLSCEANPWRRDRLAIGTCCACHQRSARLPGRAMSVTLKRSRLFMRSLFEEFLPEKNGVLCLPGSVIAPKRCEFRRQTSPGASISLWGLFSVVCREIFHGQSRNASIVVCRTGREEVLSMQTSACFFRPSSTRESFHGLEFRRIALPRSRRLQLVAYY